MDKAILPTLFLAFLVHSFIFGATVQLVNGQKTWCVAKPPAEGLELKNNIEYACKYVNCSDIQPNGKCFVPDILISHASVVMNLYYQLNGRQRHACYFGGSGLISVTDPSFGNCYYL